MGVTLLRVSGNWSICSENWTRVGGHPHPLDPSMTPSRTVNIGGSTRLAVVVNILPSANEIRGTLSLVPGLFWGYLWYQVYSGGISGTRSILGVSLVPGPFWGYLWYKVHSGGWGKDMSRGMGTSKGLVCLGRGYVQGWGRSGIYEIRSASGRYASYWNAVLLVHGHSA